MKPGSLAQFPGNEDPTNAVRRVAQARAALAAATVTPDEVTPFEALTAAEPKPQDQHLFAA